MNFFKPLTLTAAVVGFAAMNTAFAQTYDEIGDHYADLAEAVFSDSLALAKEMEEEITEFLDAPSEASLVDTKTAWIKARKTYGLSEVFRFSNPVVDEWEPQVNAWPLDEGLIDYVHGDNYFYELGNPAARANIIANSALNIGSNTVDLSELTPELLASLNEIGGTEANVATGWHAIEFLLWGQDLNETNPGAGQRPFTDFSIADCARGNCERRREYLRAATDLLISDLEFIVEEWSEGSGRYRDEFDSLPAKEKVRRILYGMGSLSLGELAGERMKVALFANSPEDEHDCFSDTTHYTLYANAAGIMMVLDGNYTRASGEHLSGPSLLSWAKENTDSLQLESTSNVVMERLSTIVATAEAGEAFDQMIAPGNTSGAEKINQSIDSLVDYTREIEKLAVAMELDTLSPDNAGHDL